MLAAVIAAAIYSEASVAAVSDTADLPANVLPPIRKGGNDGNNASSTSGRVTKGHLLAQACCGGGNGWSPGEPSIAVGKAHILETVNSSLTVYSKDPRSVTELLHADLTSFFGGGPIACIDPRVIYWSWNDRYALVCSDIGSIPNVVRFAVTAGNDPSQDWNKYAIDVPGFLDQPKIAATADKLIVSGNYGDFEEFYVYQLDDIVAGASNPSMAHLTSQHGYYQAAVEYTPANAGYFVSTCGGCDVHLATISGTPATSVSLTETSLGDSQLRSTFDPPVPDGALGGGFMDTRLLTAAYEVQTSDGQPVIQYSANTGCTLEAETICTATGRITWSGSTPVLSDVENEGAAGAAYTYGAVTLDGRGRVYLVYSRSNSTSMPSTAALGISRRGRRSFDTVIQPSAAGSSACAGSPPPCDQRWGDYFGATQDPVDPRHVWLAGLYQSSSGPFGWGTVIARARASGVR
jgi:hypothetical protein